MNYLQDGRCEISNNAAERRVKSYVMGRKNFLFHNTVDGARASATVLEKKCLSPAKKHKLYKSSINKSIHFVQRSLSSSPRVPYPVPVPNKKI